MTQHESKTDPSLLKHYCSFIQGEITYRVLLLPKHKVSQTIPRLQPEIALLIHLSPYKELSFLVEVTQAQRLIWSVRVSVCVCHFHTRQSTLNRPYAEKECIGERPSQSLKSTPPHHYTLSPSCMLSIWCHWILILPKARLIIYVGKLYLTVQSLFLILQETHCECLGRRVAIVYRSHIQIKCICLSRVSTVRTCVCSLYPLSSSIHAPFDILKNKERALPHKVKCLTITPSMAGDLQIISIDHGSDHAECRADSKIIST